MYWEPAESGSQQAVGRSGGLLARFCQHADEVIPGVYMTMTKLTLLISIPYNVVKMSSTSSSLISLISLKDYPLLFFAFM